MIEMQTYRSDSNPLSLVSVSKRGRSGRLINIASLGEPGRLSVSLTESAWSVTEAPDAAATLSERASLCLGDERADSCSARAAKVSKFSVGLETIMLIFLVLCGEVGAECDPI